MTTAYDINEVAVQGIGKSLQNAAARWEDAGAPCPSDSQREQLRAFVKEEKPNVSQARETYRLLVHLTSEAEFQKAQSERMAAMARAQAATNARRAELVTELREVRAQTGMTMQEMSALLNVPMHVVTNAEGNHGLSVDRFEQLLVGYRAVLKGMTPPTIERGKTGPRSDDGGPRTWDGVKS